jgi:tripartite-type tricarboxylate transporter receptor subunit TctC
MRPRLIALAVATLMLPTSMAVGDQWPTRALSMVIPYAAGGPTDAVGRLIARHLGDKLGHSVVVENIPGAGGMTGSSRVAQAPPDGYELLFGGAGTQVYNQILQKKPLYNSVTDFTPVALMTEQALVLIARKDLPADDLPAFIALLEAHQDVKFGSSGAGSSTHLGCALLNARIGATPTHVPYRGAAPAMQDLMAGRIDFMCNIMPDALPQIEAGTVKAIAILGRDRSQVLPNLATAAEQGLAGFDASSWFGLFLPKGAPPGVVKKLNDAARAALDEPSLRNRLQALGVAVVTSDRQSPDYLARHVKADIEKWTAPLEASGLIQ